MDTRIRLNNDQEIPALGFGTWELRGDKAYESVKFALKSGIRHIDTASMYGNEEEVGRALRDSGLRREGIFMTSKVWNDEQGYESTLEAFEKSLKRLRLDYLDMYMVHWPVIGKRMDTYKAIETLYKTGRIKNIGVCNYLVEHLEELLRFAEIKPAINQIEMHPFNFKFRKPVIDFCQRNKIQIEAYRPLVKAVYNNHAGLQNIALKYDASVPQILIRWSLQKGFVVIPRSADRIHIAQNIDVFGLDIKLEDMKVLDALNENLSSTSLFGPEDFL